MPRLLQRRRVAREEPADDAHSPEPQDQSAREGNEGDELPPYEPPSFPLNEAERRALLQEMTGGDTRSYLNHLSKSANLIRDYVGQANDSV
jgi:hypothetical protein